MARNQRRLEMARAHAKRSWYCTCGKIVHGNGGSHMHGEMHKRKSDGHYYMTYSDYMERRKQAEAAGANVLCGRTPGL